MRINKKSAITGGILIAAACAAAVPAATAQASTRTAGHVGGTQAAHTVRPLSTNGCSSGTVCMYTSSGWGSGVTEHHWWQYGCYNLSGEYGTRYVFNNQTGGAGASLWTGSNCTGSSTRIGAGQTWQGNITPINSISLYP